MLEHMVLFRRKAHATEAQEDALIEQLRKLKDQIPEIVELTAGRSMAANESGGYTCGLVVRFRDRAGLEAYLPHPAHQKVVAVVRDICDDVLGLDFEF